MTRALLFSAALLLAGPAAAAGAAADAAQGYTVEVVATPAALRLGERGTVAVVIHPRRPVWHVHPQAPLRVRLEAGPGLKLERVELGRRDVVDPKAEAPRLESPFVASARGAQQVRASVDFFLCSDAACVKQVRQLAVAVDVR